MPPLRVQTVTLWNPGWYVLGVLKEAADRSQLLPPGCGASVGALLTIWIKQEEEISSVLLHLLISPRWCQM